MNWQNISRFIATLGKASFWSAAANIGQEGKEGIGKQKGQKVKAVTQNPNHTLEVPVFLHWL